MQLNDMINWFSRTRGLRIEGGGTSHIMTDNNKDIHVSVYGQNKTSQLLTWTKLPRALPAL